MAFSFKKFLKGITIIPTQSSNASVAGDIEVVTVGGTPRAQYHNGSTVSPLVTLTSADQGAQRLQNKDLDASLVQVVDPADTTKALGWQTSGATTGTKTTIIASQTQNRSITLPDATDTLTGKATTDTLTNKTIDAASNTISNLADANIQTGAAITRSKLATGTTYRILANDVSGVMSENAALTAGRAVIVDSHGQLADEANLAITRGGTGAGTASAAFDALSPTTTKGDIAVRNSSTNTRLPIGTDGQVIVADSSQANGLKWTTLQQGAKNYITYGNFENGATTGWSLQHSTLDSNSKLPNQSSGSWTAADGTLSISAVNTNVLAGNFSLSYASSGVTTAGDMLITDAYTLDAEDQAKVLSFRFYYKAQSGASNGNFSGTSSNSFGVAIYDVNSGTWIQPAGVYNITQSSGIGLCTGTFQTLSNSSSIRLAIYNVNATSGAITLYIDDVVVSPQIIPFGAPVTDWQSYTPTFTGGTPTNGTISGKWRRVGDSMEIEGSVEFSGAAGSFSSVVVSIPSGYSIDATKLAQQTASANRINLGISYCYHSGIALYPGIVNYTSSTTFTVFSDNVSGSVITEANVTNTAPFSFGTNDLISWKLCVPITGWSSSVQMSNDTDTRVVAMKAYAATTPTGSLSTAFNAVIYGTVASDTHNSYNSSTGIYTAPVSGYYDVVGSFLVAGTVAAGNRLIAKIYINGSHSNNSAIHRAASTQGPNQVIVAANSLYLNAGDTLQVMSYCEYTSPSFSSDPDAHFFTVTRLSGPATIAANETVAATYLCSKATSCGSGSTQTTIPFDTLVFDTHGAMNTTTGVYTCPVSGKYDVRAMILFATASWTVGDKDLILVKTSNGTPSTYYMQIYAVAAAYSDNLGLNGSFIASCNAGDTLEVKVQHNESTNRTLYNTSTVNNVSIKRIGN